MIRNELPGAADVEGLRRKATRLRRLMLDMAGGQPPGCCRLRRPRVYGASVQVPVTRIGLPDRFIKCRSVPTLQARFGITANAMVDTDTITDLVGKRR